MVAEGGCQDEINAEDEREKEHDDKENEAEEELFCEPCEGQDAEEWFCGPCEESAEGIDADVEVESEEQQVASDPGQPTRAERALHEVTHFPFRPWCPLSTC